MASNAKSVLITGAAGFIGARFVEAYAKKHPEVKILSVDHPDHFRDRPEHQGLPFGTIIDREKLFDWLKSNRPDLVGIVHLGACSDTTEYDEEFLRRVNVEYSQKLWDYASQIKIPFVYASSAATYGDGSQGYADDESKIGELKPLNPYGESKRKFDLWALEQEKRGHQPPAWSGFKFFNVYGFGERHKTKMWSVVLRGYEQILKSGVIHLFKSYRPDYKDGEQKRDFIYVGDVCDVLLYALEKPIRRGIFNLGSGKAQSWLDLARATFKAMNRQERIGFIEMPENLRERYQYFTEARMERLRGEGYAKPFTSLEKGVALYIERLSKFHDSK